MRVIHDKCGSLLVNAGMYAKKLHLVLTFAVKSRR